MLSTESGNLNGIRRRQFLLAAGALLIARIGAQAQQARRPYRIGILAVEDDEILRQSLRDLGYFE
jgi:hypothetical protein